MAKVPYRDMTQAPTDLAEGRIQVLMASLATMQPQMQTGRIKVVAVTSRARAPIVPDIPTVIEAGYPALAMDGLVGLFGPRGMARNLRERIASDQRKWMRRGQTDPTNRPAQSSVTFNTGMAIQERAIEHA
jgi:tripartite-type tricarboxylate transporter receptor subunit TctC